MPPRGHYFVTHDTLGHTFHYARKGPAASRLSVHDLPSEAVSKAQVLHLSGISLAVSETMRAACFEAMHMARSAGVRVSLDLNYRPALWSVEQAAKTLEAAISLTDILLPGLEDAHLLTGLNDPDEIIDKYMDMGPGIVALTMGAKGVRIEAGARFDIKPLAVDAVDVTGAGDAFDGAFLAALVSGTSPHQAALRARVAAGLSVTSFGAVASIPDQAATNVKLSEELSNSS